MIEQLGIKDSCETIRGNIGGVLKDVRVLMERCKAMATPMSFPEPAAPTSDRGEMIANATLAYRHLEDARMRLGKVIQASEGGVSRYDAQPG